MSIRQYLTLPVLIGILGACGQRTDSNSTSPKIDFAKNLFNTPNSRWASGVSKNADALQDLFAEDAIRVQENGQSQDSRTAIVAFYKEQPAAIKNLRTLHLIVANVDSTIYYEVGTFVVGESPFKFLAIWQVASRDTVRLFEFIARAGEGETFSDALAHRRQNWMDYCNQHNVDKLVDELYTENAIYFNHKPLVRGREQLKQEYSYMSREQYHLRLTPIVREPVNETLCFEIGQCGGSYGGKYILIWQRDHDGTWRVLLDSNI